jgi:hypothetical protein
MPLVDRRQIHPLNRGQPRLAALRKTFSEGAKRGGHRDCSAGALWTGFLLSGPQQFVGVRPKLPGDLDELSDIEPALFPFEFCHERLRPAKSHG